MVGPLRGHRVKDRGVDGGERAVEHHLEPGPPAVEQPVRGCRIVGEFGRAVAIVERRRRQHRGGDGVATRIEQRLQAWPVDQQRQRSADTWVGKQTAGCIGAQPVTDARIVQCGGCKPVDRPGVEVARDGLLKYQPAGSVTQPLGRPCPVPGAQSRPARDGEVHTGQRPQERRVVSREAKRHGVDVGVDSVEPGEHRHGGRKR